MASFGENLRREREMRGVSLEEISASTKINLRFLQALEAEDFAKIPGGIFTRSFLRAYADYLGLDTERILAEYQLVAPPVVEGISSFNKMSLPQARRGSGGRFVPWLVAVPLLAAGYLLYRYSHRTPEIPVSVPVPPPVSSPPVPSTQNAAASPSLQGGVSSAPTSDTQAAANSTTQDATNSATQPDKTSSPRGESVMGAEQSPSGSQPNPSAPSATGAVTAGAESPPGTRGESPPVTSVGPTGPSREGGGDLVLEVTTTERAWVAVDADGKTIFQHTLDPNEVKTFTAKDSFEVWTGNAQGTVLTLNGAKQKSLGREGEIKRVRLTRDGLQQPVR
jgi:cytoskeleton protein RodZ